MTATWNEKNFGLDCAGSECGKYDRTRSDEDSAIMFNLYGSMFGAKYQCLLEM